MSLPEPSKPLRQALRLVDLASRIVPVRLREDWRREWSAELWYRDQSLVEAGAGAWRRLVRLTVPAAGSFVHAIRLRTQPGEWSSAFGDVRFAVRGLRRAPVFAVGAVLTLGLAIAANVAVYSAAKGAFLSPYAYADAERIGVLAMEQADQPGDVLRLAYPDLELLADIGAFESVAAYDWDPFNLRLDDRTEWVGGGRVTADLFAVLGVAPLQGRGFLPGDDQPGAPPVAVLSETLWRNAFGAAEVVGQTIVLDGTVHEIVGVVPGFVDIPEGADLWVPLAPTGQAATRQSFWLRAVARLAPAATWAQAQSELEALSAALAEDHSETHEGRTFASIPLREFRTDGVRPAFAALLGAVVVLLLIVCANLSSLMLARSNARRQEFGVRQALGASRGRLLKQLLVENLVIAVVAAGVGLLVGTWAISALQGLVPDLPTWYDGSLDRSVVAVALGLALVSTLVFGLTTSWKGVWRLEPGVEREAGRSTASTRDLLVFSEISLSTVLLIAAVVLVRSLTALMAVDPGFDAEGRIAGSLQLPASRYADDAQVRTFAAELLSAVEAQPGIESAGLVTRMPFRSGLNTVLWWEDGQSEQAFRENPEAELNTVTTDYFGTLNVGLRAGRAFDPDDGPDAPAVVAISETFAREHFGTRDPIGARISYQYPPRFVEVVGVVEDVKHLGLDQAPQFQIYAPFDQRPTQRMTLVASTAGDPALMAGPIRAIVRRLDPDLALSGLDIVDNAVRDSVWQVRLLSRLFWMFGAFAVLLASVGIAGVVAYAVSRRRREIGVRLALGADASSILSLLGRRIGVLVSAGLVVGVSAAFVVARSVDGRLYGVDSLDPGPYLTVVAGFVLLAGAALWVPARRALAVDPVEALRDE